MIRAVFAIPGDLATPTGGYGYDREVLARLHACGIAAAHLQLPDGFPAPSAAALHETMRRLADVAPKAVLLVDGLAFGVLPASELATLRAPLVALVHHPLGHETGLSSAERVRLLDLERAALSCARHIIVTSDTTREGLASEFAIEPSRITVAPPGVDELPRATGSSGDACLVLSVGSLVPRKGYDVLIEALSGLREMPWRLRIVGGRRDPLTAEILDESVRRLGLEDRIEFAGELTTDALRGVYPQADLFVLASHYEGYGMVLGEAMSCGLPIVTTTGGAAARTVPDGAALKVPAGDMLALREALRLAVSDPILRRRLADASWRSGQSLPGWSATAETIASVLRNMAQETT